MRANLVLLPLLMCTAPALAQAPAASPAIQVPHELIDPATADKLAKAMQTLSKAFLNLPVGEVQAALEGRQPTAAEKRVTVRDLGQRDDPNFERDFQRQIAQSKPVIEQSMKALAAALPAMIESVGKAQESLERAAANIPRPDYPRR
jgi:hypothetical protein